MITTKELVELQKAHHEAAAEHHRQIEKLFQLLQTHHENAGDDELAAHFEKLAVAHADLAEHHDEHAAALDAAGITEHERLRRAFQ